MMPVPSEWLTDQEVIAVLGMSKRTLSALLATAPAGAPVAYVNIGVGARCPRRRWRPDLIWAWLEAVQAHVASIRIVRKPRAAPKPRPKVKQVVATPVATSPRPTLRSRVRAHQLANRK